MSSNDVNEIVHEATLAIEKRQRLKKIPPIENKRSNLVVNCEYEGMK